MKGLVRRTGGRKPSIRRRASSTRWRGPVLGAVLLCAAPPAAHAQEGAGERAAAARDVEAREIAFARTMADRDFEAFMTFLADEAIFFAGDRPIRGADAIGDAWRSFCEGEAAPFSWHPEVVEVLESGELAISSGRRDVQLGLAQGCGRRLAGGLRQGLSVEAC